MKNDYVVADAFEVGKAQDVIQSGSKTEIFDENGQALQVSGIDDDE